MLDPILSEPLTRSVAEVAAAVRAGGCRRITGPGGSGKSRLLGVLAGWLDGFEVVRWSGARGRPPERAGTAASSRAGAVLLLDDAHLLDEQTLAELVGQWPSVVLAHRPLRRPEARLLDRLDRSPVVLRPLDHDEARDLLADVWQQRPSPVLTDELLLATAGLPRVLLAVAGQGPVTRPRCTPALEDVVRAERWELSEAGRTLLLGAALLDGVGRTSLAKACDLSEAALDAAAAELLDAGLAVNASPRLLPVVVEAVRRVGTETEFAALAERAAMTALDGEDPAVVAEQLVAAGATGPTIGRCLVVAAHRLATREPERAEDLRAAARRAGAAANDLAALDAVLGFHRGELDTTLGRLDHVLAMPDSPLRDEAVRAAVGVLAARGGWLRAAQLVGAGSRTQPDLAVLGFVAAGDVTRARAVPVPELSEALGLRTGRLRALIDGLRCSLDDDAFPALLHLLEATRLEELAPECIALPEPVHVLAGLVAAQLGELDLAADAVTGTTRDTSPWAPRRTALMAAWISLRRGDWVGAEHQVAQVRASPVWAGADPRDHLLADAVEAGAARRRGDLVALLQVWRRARSLLLRMPPDLLSLGAAGELLIGGARLGDHATVRSARVRIDALLADAGEPPLWALPARWDQMHAAIASDDLAAARAAATATSALPPAGPRVAVLATAAPVWVGVLHGEFERGQVEATTEELSTAGLLWEAARLAGAAAIRARDSETMRALLHLARSLPAPAAPSLVNPVGELSVREQEVAAHLLAGRTYRQIGAQLFIAPKTVEHHVARIRRKLGVSSRAELLVALRRQLPADGVGGGG